MKKNITINLFGALYTIDEDAYELLEKYTDNLHTYFDQQDGGKEIAEDIERRIGELFAELKENGNEAISLEQMQEIIGRLGKPEDMDSNDEGAEDKSADSADSTGDAQQSDSVADESKNPRKLFRDMRNAMLGGVMSGLSWRLGGDVTVWRLGIILFAVATMSFSSIPTILAYVIAWIVIPEARTAEDFLLMEGKEVNADSIGKMVMDDTRKPEKKGWTVFSVILKVLFYLLVGCILCVWSMGLLGAVVVAIVAAASTILTGLPFGLFGDYTNLGNMDVLNAASGDVTVMFWLMMASIIVFLAIPLYCAVHHILTFFRVPNMSRKQRMTWCLIWLVSFLMVVYSSIVFAGKIQKLDDAIRPRGSIKSTNSGWETMLDAYRDDEENRFVKDSVLSQLDRFHFKGDCRFNESNAVKLQPGVYRLSIKALCSRKGFSAFVKTADSTYTEPVLWGSPDRISESHYDSDKNDYVFVCHDLPQNVVDSVVVKSPGIVEFGIRDIREKDYRYFYIIYSGDYHMERIR